MDVLTGVVKWFHEAKGYGFLAADGIDYFAHYKAIVGEWCAGSHRGCAAAHRRYQLQPGMPSI